MREAQPVSSLWSSPSTRWGRAVATDGRSGANMCGQAGAGCPGRSTPRDPGTLGKRRKPQLKLRLDNRASSCSEVCSSQQPQGHLFLPSPTQLCNWGLCWKTNPVGRLLVIFWRMWQAPFQTEEPFCFGFGLFPPLVTVICSCHIPACRGVSWLWLTAYFQGQACICVLGRKHGVCMLPLLLLCTGLRLAQCFAIVLQIGLNSPFARNKKYF